MPKGVSGGKEKEASRIIKKCITITISGIEGGLKEREGG